MSNATRILISSPGSKAPYGAREVVSPNGYSSKSPWRDLAASLTGFSHTEYMGREWEVASRIHEMTLERIKDIEPKSLIAMLWAYRGEICGRVYEYTEECSLPGDCGLMLRFRTEFWRDLDSFTEIV